MNKKILAITKSNKERFLLLRTNPKWLDKKEFIKQIDGYNEKEDIKKISLEIASKA